MTTFSPSVVNQAFVVDQGLTTPDRPQTGDHETVLAIERAELLSRQVNYEEIIPPPPPRLPRTLAAAASAVMRSPPPPPQRFLQNKRQNREIDSYLTITIITIIILPTAFCCQHSIGLESFIFQYYNLPVRLRRTDNSWYHGLRR